METFDIWPLYAESVRTALGFFWKAGWAFVLGYAVSAMIQAFVGGLGALAYVGMGNGAA
jgi:hypothetical protein